MTLNRIITKGNIVLTCCCEIVLNAFEIIELYYVTYLWTIFDVMPFLETQMTQII